MGTISLRADATLLYHAAAVFRNPISKASTISDDSFTPNEKRTLLGVALAAGLRILGISLILPVFALYQDGMKASTAEIGLALGIYSFTNAAFQVPLGFLSDRIGRKGVLLGGMLVFAIGSFMAAWAPTIWLSSSRALQGSGAIGASSTRWWRTPFPFPGAIEPWPTSESRRGRLHRGDDPRPPPRGAYGIPFLFALMGGLVLACGCYILLFIPGAGKTRGLRGSGRQPREIPFLLADRDLLRVNLGSFLMNFLMSALFLALPSLLAAVMPMAYFSLFYLPLVLVGVIVLKGSSRTADRKGGRAIAVGVPPSALSPILLGVPRRLSSSAHPRGAILLFLHLHPPVRPSWNDDEDRQARHRRHGRGRQPDAPGPPGRSQARPWRHRASHPSARLHWSSRRRPASPVRSPPGHPAAGRRVRTRTAIIAPIASG